MLESYPHVPLIDNLGLGIALLSYDGRIYWGFNADYDVVPDLEDFVARHARCARGADARSEAAFAQLTLPWLLSRTSPKQREAGGCACREQREHRDVEAQRRDRRGDRDDERRGRERGPDRRLQVQRSEVALVHAREEHVQREPDGEVQDHADDGGRDRRERAARARARRAARSM